MPAVLNRRSLPAAALVTLVVGVGLIAYAPLAASAQPATGSITGRVVWGPCIRLPLPMAPGASEPGAPPPGPAESGQPDTGQAQPSRPVQPVRGLPAGAVLVAVQNTSVNTRTDETGRFTLTGVPAGTYLTVAAGPVGDASDATAQRPNVLVNGGQSTDAGTLVLGGQATFGVACRAFVPFAESAGSPTDTTPPTEP